MNKQYLDSGIFQLKVPSWYPSAATELDVCKSGVPPRSKRVPREGISGGALGPGQDLQK